MKSKWYELKQRAILLRKKGKSIRSIEVSLKIPRSTLSGWFSKVALTTKQRDKLFDNWQRSLAKARAQAVLWHHAQKENRLAQARQEAFSTLDRITVSKKEVVDLALAMLYLGEGFKSSPDTALGSSSPLILKFFIRGLCLVYGLSPASFRCELHLRADQDPLEIRKFWRKELGVPMQNFTSVSFDKRTKGTATYDGYKGVCVVRCSRASIQRKLLYLAELFSEKVIQYKGG